MKKRAGLYIGMIIAIILVLCSSMYIWEVRVEGNTYVSDSDIIKTLRTLGISEGSKKNRDILEMTYNSFLMAESRISWISINFDGTVAHVEVKETKQIPEKIDRNRNINIVAGSDGIVKRIDVLDGTKEVENGETVTKGQLLISSFVETRKTGTVMKAARGSVWATTVRNCDIYVPKNTISRITGDSNKSRYINVLGKELNIEIPFLNSLKKYSKTTETGRITVFRVINLPVVIRTDTMCEYNYKTIEISENQASEIAEIELENKMKAVFENGEIIQKSCSIEEKEDCYIFKYELTCIENIAKETEFEFN